jgi:hypothetical protein
MCQGHKLYLADRVGKVKVTMNVQMDVMLLVTSLISAFVFWEARSPKSRLKLSCVMVVPIKAESAVN